LLVFLSQGFRLFKRTSKMLPLHFHLNLVNLQFMNQLHGIGHFPRHLERRIGSKKRNRVIS
jgi:hypothetical protein